MVFSFPNYLDHPNLHQFQQNQEHQQQSIIGVENHQLQPLQAPPPPLAAVGIGGPAGLVRPGSMVDRARMAGAQLPLPEAGAKCPRCDSTNTKFCYYNNYNLSQPRHFCKGCRRYWTKGGSLRNVPVGGGCRRNKRSKSNGSTSKSVAGDERQPGINNNNNNNSSTTNGAAVGPSIRGGITTNMAGHHFQHYSTQLPYMSSLHNFNQYAVTEPGFHGLGDIRFNIPSNTLSSGGSAGPSAEPPGWMLPSIQGGFDPATSFFQFQREGVEDRHQLPSMEGTRSSNNDASVVKMENHQNGNQEVNNLLLSSHQSLDASETRQQNWGSNAWTTDDNNGFPGLNSSSSNHIL